KLLTKMNEAITSAKNDKVFMVLHTYGNHGPAYNKRYPKKFEKFTPVCESVDLKECTEESLINAYDNSVVYVDYFVNKTIEEVKKLDRPAVVIFVSDHGESLGEYGLYMHGAPNAIAPDFQRKIPYVLWASKKFLGNKGQEKLKIDTSIEYEHDTVFHTVMGAFGMKSPIYKKEFDILSQ
ncbi:MAG: sulfatase-like hydrolase/transferase, partial [Campylobacterales bacterium]|nr:sulfatase-like hydrolase/transferase [Campylobacterales bacterium]